MDLREIKEFLKDAFKYLILVVVVLVVALYIVGLQQVVGPSMEPTLNNKDVLILDKISIKIFALKRNDIIAFYDENEKYLIKRIVGLPGEKIEYKNNTLYVNGQSVEEKYLQGVTTEDFSINSLGYETIPNNMYFVLGDNRQNSKDSRDISIGLVEKKDIIGKVRLRIWPLFKIKR